MILELLKLLIIVFYAKGGRLKLTAMSLQQKVSRGVRSGQTTELKHPVLFILMNYLLICALVVPNPLVQSSYKSYGR